MERGFAHGPVHRLGAGDLRQVTFSAIFMFIRAAAAAAASTTQVAAPLPMARKAASAALRVLDM
ncbi:hypothetical protein HGG74_12555 [Arthrobacter sp. E918]|uniref:Uncharacterized protein n=1 Tax=Arthrobacter mobilis TaxID=2724944 RepID=A0A7X6K6I0_9MICC|nr:hypothetical protein [Arthrobacter mobilis]